MIGPAYVIIYGASAYNYEHGYASVPYAEADDFSLLSKHETSKTGSRRLPVFPCQRHQKMSLPTGPQADACWLRPGNWTITVWVVANFARM